MTGFYLHLLNARHALTPILPEIRAAARQALERAAACAEVPEFDLIVRAQTGGGTTDGGLSGHAPAPAVVEIGLDPARFDPEALIRTLIRQMHHLIRWEGPVQGRSLGEALVSEGLAGHFVMQVLGGPPDPWDRTVPAPGLMRRANAEWARLDFSHAEWFQGKAGLRRWSGHGLGHRLIAAHLTQAPGETAASLARAGAETFRPALRRLLATDPPEPPAG